MNPPLFHEPNGADDFHTGLRGIAAEAGAVAVTTAAAVTVTAATRLNSTCRIGAPHCAGFSDLPDCSGQAGDRGLIRRLSIVMRVRPGGTVDHWGITDQLRNLVILRDVPRAAR